MRGFTLLEVVIAVLVLEVGVLAVLGTLTVAARNLSEAERLERASASVEGVRDSLALVSEPTSGARAEVGMALTWTVERGDDVVLLAVDDEGRTLVQVRSTLSVAP